MCAIINIVNIGKEGDETSLLSSWIINEEKCQFTNTVAVPAVISLNCYVPSLMLRR